MGQVSYVKSHLVCWPIDLATRPISMWLALGQCWVPNLIWVGQGIFGSMLLPWCGQCLVLNFDSGTSTAFLYDSAVEEAGQKDDIFRFLTFVWCGRSHRTLGTVVAKLLYSGALTWTYLIAIWIIFLSIILILFYGKNQWLEGRNEALLTFKTNCPAEFERMAWKTSTLYWMMTYQLVGTTHVYVLLLLSTENKWPIRLAGFTGHADW